MNKNISAAATETAVARMMNLTNAVAVENVIASNVHKTPELSNSSSQ
jgi:hypothetical protein